jgi:hypothetical protein
MAKPDTSAAVPVVQGKAQPWKKWYSPDESKPKETVVQRAMETFDDGQNGRGPVGISATEFDL